MTPQGPDEPATVHCIVPSFDRPEAASRVLELFHHQTYPNVSGVLVEHGTDPRHARELAAAHPKATVLRGNPDMWWSGAVDQGVQHALQRAMPGDFLLLQNDDVDFGTEFVAGLVATSLRNGRAVVGASTWDIHDREHLVALGASIDLARMEVRHVLDLDPSLRLRKDPIEVDALLGRGVLYPVEFFRRTGTLAKDLLPHYWADYELSARAKRHGFKVLVDPATRVWTELVPPAIDHGKAELRRVLSSRRSAANLMDQLVFFSLVGPWWMRITAIPRFLVSRAGRWVRRRARASAGNPQR